VADRVCLHGIASLDLRAMLYPKSCKCLPFNCTHSPPACLVFA
jgi:hypothetical protein